jgi:hypothetical protein
MRVMRARRANAIASPHDEEKLEFRASFVTDSGAASADGGAMQAADVAPPDDEGGPAGRDGAAPDARRPD